MTKAEIVNEISDRTGIEKAIVQETVECFFKVVKSSLVNDENVPIVLVTHEVIEKNIIDALKDIEKLEVVKGKIIKIRIEELES